MRGQLNLFSFAPRIEFYEATTKELNSELWKLIRKNDPRGYSFREFNNFTNWKNKPTATNKRCPLVVIYKGKKPIGFCTISLQKFRADPENGVMKPGKTAYLDVWVLPYYRDMGFGSILVRRATEEALRITGSLPEGHDKHHSHCWIARIERQDRMRAARGEEDEESTYDPNWCENAKRQQVLFSPKSAEESKRETIKRLVNGISQSTELSGSLVGVCMDKIASIGRSFFTVEEKEKDGPIGDEDEDDDFYLDDYDDDYDDD